LKVTDQIADFHFDNIKRITKNFIDPTNDGFRECSNYAPFLAWATQFVIYVRHSKAEQKVLDSINALEREKEAKE